MKLQAIDLEMYGMAELSLEDQLCINGEYSWNEFCNDVGYGAGSCVAYATNAASIINEMMVDALTGKAIERIFRK
ncbi:hypothetical protein [Dyadobacter tibetensis]|uniref:hypothetical protein n=1 Tax=Dyadobacter tibetensis TaxID=1211851 RepID=UPI00046EDAA8|nr:hypothetical protein [Dyadobacter tibetensis]